MFLVIYEKTSPYSTDGSRVLGNHGQRNELAIADGPFSTPEEAKEFIDSLTWETKDEHDGRFYWGGGKLYLSCGCCTAKPVIVRVREKGEKGYWN